MTRTAEAVFELLRFRALPVGAGVAVVELEGRFSVRAGRLGRQPELIVERFDAPAVRLTPAAEVADGLRWCGTYAIPIDALESGARFALGVRGALLELPEPDLARDGDRLARLAREANALRHQLVLVQDDADRATAADRAREEAEAVARAATDRAQAADAALADALGAHAAELEQVRSAGAAELEAARATHAAELQAARAQLEEAGATHAAELDELRGAHAAELEQLRASHATARDEQRAAAAAELDEVRTRLTGQLEVAQADAGDQVVHLRAELEEVAGMRDAERARHEADGLALQRHLDELEALLAERDAEIDDLRGQLDTTREHAEIRAQDLRRLDEADEELPEERAAGQEGLAYTPGEEPPAPAADPTQETRAFDPVEDDEDRTERLAPRMLPITAAGAARNGRGDTGSLWFAQPAAVAADADDPPTAEQARPEADPEQGPILLEVLRWTPVAALVAVIIVLLLLVL